MAVERFLYLRTTGGADLQGRNYKVYYRVFVTDPMDGPATIMTSPLFPFRMRERYQIGNDYDDWAGLTEVDPTPVPGNNYEWDLVLTFSFLPPGEENESPFDRPPQYEWLFSNGEKAIERDVHGKRIGNTAGDRFDEIITREDSQPILKITRNEPADMLFFGFDIRDCVNRDPWFGAPRRTVKFQPPRAVSKYDRDWGLYYEKNYEFKFSDDTWRIVMLNQGLRELKPSTNEDDPPKLVRMKDDEGNEITEPLPLDAQGARLPKGQEPVYLEFDGYPETTFPAF